MEYAGRGVEPADRTADGRGRSGSSPFRSCIRVASDFTVTGAIALAIVLVVARGRRQHGFREPAQLADPGGPPGPSDPTPPRRRTHIAAARDRGIGSERRKADPATTPLSDLPPSIQDAESRGPELQRSGVAAEAKVISVVDERTIGPVTRSRLALRIDPGDGPAFEVTWSEWPSRPRSRASKVKVGGTVAVHYDQDDRTRVVVDLPPE